MPEIDSYNNPIIPSKRQQKNNNRSHVNYEQFEESTSQKPRVSRKNRRIPKANYKDSAAYDSNISIRKTPKVIHEEVFGYKNPEIRKYSKQSKNKAVTIETYLPMKKENYFRAAKYYKKDPRIDNESASKNKDPFVNIRKLSKYSPKEMIRSNVKQSDPDNAASFYGPNIMSG